MVEFIVEKDEFLTSHPSFSLKECVSYPNGSYSKFYDNNEIMVIIDYGICDINKGDSPFSYMLITDKQNNYMHQYERVFRFLGYDKDEVDYYLNKKEMEWDIQVKRIANREEQASVSPLEFHFEQCFTSVYGMNALKYLQREYPLVDEDNHYYFLDYVIYTKNNKYGVEENGVTYHHPQMIGKEKYKKQLKKQNTCTLWGIKLFRFSSEDCHFENRIVDDIKRFFGEDASLFEYEGLKVERQFELYQHQSDSLQEIQRRRKEGVKAFLVVLPTSAGKSLIVEEDIKTFSQNIKDFKALILVPGVDILNDWINRIKKSLPELENKIDIKTYAYMAIHYQEFSHNYYHYLVVDEAHHAVAPVLKRVIQYFDSQFLIGLTATDERLDNKRLEEVFGQYETPLSLEEAMKKEIVAKANVYRIETNIDLSKVRFNGKDYVNADLEKNIRVTSRNELIVQVLKDYFSEGAEAQRQGVIFCVNVAHANEMARLLNEASFSAMSYTGQTKNPRQVMNDFKSKKIRFLCACNMISEGWDYPELGILVMARPTLSKVLYVQQIGRGLRRTNTKKNVIVIDVVDEYGAMLKAYNMHSLFSNPYYVPFGDITKTDYKQGDMVIVDGIEERIEKIVEVDIHTFEEKYGDYLSHEQVAREYFVSTSTLTSWIKKEKLKPTIKQQFGSKTLYFFSPDDVNKYRKQLHIKEHNDSTIKQDFFDFIEERDYSLSYKMPFMLSLLKHVNTIGDAQIDEVLTDYILFYQDRLNRGLPIDRKTCPYNQQTLKDKKLIKRNMLTNPFEKFERKRFLYYSKDLNIISINHALFSQMNKEDWLKVENQFQEDLKNYYKEMGGL